MRKLSLLALVATMVLCAGAAFALVNPGFETGDTTGWSVATDGDKVAGVYDTWTDGEATINPGAGNYFGAITRSGGSQPPLSSWFSQAIPVTQGATYTFAVSGKAVAYKSTFDPGDPGSIWSVGARIGLLNGDAPASSYLYYQFEDIMDRNYGVGSTSLWLGDIDWDEWELTENYNGVWRDYSFSSDTFTARTDHITLVLCIKDDCGLDDGDDLLVGFDSALCTIIPEPGTVACLLSGLAGLVGFGIRRRR